MNLELKHLAAYLPYELKYMTDLEVEKHELKSIDFGIKMVNFGHGDAKLVSEIKPILRNLSDLTREIEVNGEKFVPIEKIKNENVSNIECDLHGLYLNQKDEAQLNIIQFWMIENYLFEWHFDVFGLISAGLAIDINTLKNE